MAVLQSQPTGTDVDEAVSQTQERFAEVAYQIETKAEELNDKQQDILLWTIQAANYYKFELKEQPN